MEPNVPQPSMRRKRWTYWRLARRPFKILAALIMLSAAVSAHEFGHLLAAKAVGIHADRFSVGFGPVLFKTEIGGTEYCLSWIPAGGYVRFPGKVEQGETPFKSQPVWKRLTAIGAGPISSVLFAALLFAAVALFNKLDSAGKKKKRKLSAENETGDSPPPQWKISKLPPVESAENESDDSPPPQEPEQSDSAPAGTVSMTAGIFKETFAGIGRIIARKESTDSLRGPIGIVDEIQKEMTGSWSWSALAGICLLTGCISVGLGAFNLLPIPPLDGGKMALLLIEAGIGRPLNATLLTIIEFAGMFAVIYFFIWIAGKDIFRKKKK